MKWDVAVVGAGVFGAWTAWHLRRAGASVLLVDAWGPGNSLASSGGESRVIRMGYGADEIYTRMSMRSLSMWRQLFDRTGKRLFQRTGVLLISRENHPYSIATHETLLRCGVPMERFTHLEMARRYPQMRFDDPQVFGILEPESGAVMARRAVALVVEDAIENGVRYEIRAVSSVHEIDAGAVVFACGPWLPKLFPDVVGKRIVPTRQEVFFFSPPPGDCGLAPDAFPVWIDFTDSRCPYGFPNLESRGFKLAFDRHGSDFDPDSGDRRVSAEGLAEAYRFLGERFPALSNAVLTESRVCQYENTCNGDFLIDRHPNFENLWLVGGGSGHGFKHGPAVGEYVTSQILHGAECEPRFSLAGKSEIQQRTVY